MRKAFGKKGIRDLLWLDVPVETFSQRPRSCILIQKDDYRHHVSPPVPEPLDAIRKIRGVGGAEYVYEKRIDKIQLGTIELTNFKIQIGDMDYGFDIDGIIGLFSVAVAHCECRDVCHRPGIILR